MLTRGQRDGSTVLPVLVVFSVGLLATSALFDAAGLASGQSAWTAVALRDREAGLAGGVAVGILALAAVAGTLPGSGERRLALGWVAAQWGVIGLLVEGLALRGSGQEAGPGACRVALSTGGLALAVLAAWLSSVLDERLRGAQGRTARTKPSARW